MSTIVGDAWVAIRPDTTGFSTALSGAMSKPLADAESGFGKIGKAALVGGAIVGAAVVGIGVEAVKMATAFQTSQTQLVTGAGESQKNLGMVSAGILQMAGQVGIGAQQLSTGMYLVESAGFHAGAGLTVLKAAAEGAAVGGASMTTVANALTSALNAYGLPASSAVAITNTLVATVASGKMRMDDLAGSLGKIVPTASTAGVSLAEVGAAMSTMTMMGVPADQAATFLRQTIISLEAPSAKASAALTDIGLGSVNMAALLKKPDGLIQAVGMINTALDQKFPAAAGLFNAEMLKVKAGTETTDQAMANLANNGGAGYINALKDIAGGSKTMQGLLDLTGTHLQTLQTNFDNINGAVARGGASVTGFALVSQDFGFKIDAAKAAVGAWLIQLGTMLLPVLSQLADWFTKTVIPALQQFGDWFKSALPTIEGAVKAAFGVIAAVVSTAVGMFGAVYSTLQHWGLLVPIIAGLAAAFVVWKVALLGMSFVAFIAGIGNAAKAMLGFDAAANANPIGLIAIAIAAVVAVTVLMITHWNQVVGIARTVWTAVAGFLKPVFDAVMVVVNALKGPLTVAFNVIKTVAVTVFDIWKTEIGIVITILGALVGVITGALTVAFNVIKAVATVVWTVIGGSILAVVTVLGGLVSFIQGVLTVAFKAIGTVAGAVWGAIWAAINALLGPIQTVIGWISGALTGAFNAIGSVAGPIFGGIWKAVNALLGPIQAVIGAIQTAVQWIGKLFSAGTGGTVQTLIATFQKANPGAPLPPSLAAMAHSAGIPGYALGGLSIMPDQGGLALLHGREFVVPEVNASPDLQSLMSDAIRGGAITTHAGMSALTSGRSGGSSVPVGAGASIVQHFTINGGNPGEVQAVIARENTKVLAAIRAGRR